MLILETKMDKCFKVTPLPITTVSCLSDRVMQMTRLLLNSLLFVMSLSIFMLATAPVMANTIVADRPGFSTGTYTVKPGRVNLEFGYQAALSNEGSDKTTHTTPLLTLRTGLSERTEINLLWSGWNHVTSDNPSDTSVADLSIGGKYRLLQTEKYNVTALGLLSLPVGTGVSTSDHVDPTIGLLGDYSLSDNIDLFGVIQTASSVATGGRDYNFQSAIGLAFSHTETIGTFIEYYNDIPLQSGDGSTSHVINGGVMWLATSDIQLDINGGVSLDNNADDFIGLGMAIRF